MHTQYYFYFEMLRKSLLCNGIFFMSVRYMHSLYYLKLDHILYHQSSRSFSL
jgi:hypothetical protein